MGINPSPSAHSLSSETWHSLAAAFLNAGNAPGQRADFSTVKAERNAVDAQTVGLNLWERLWPCAGAVFVYLKGEGVLLRRLCFVHSQCICVCVCLSSSQCVLQLVLRVDGRRHGRF